MQPTLHVPFFVEALPGKGYRATAFDLHAEAQTADEAEAHLREQITHRIRRGGKFGTLLLRFFAVPYRFAVNRNGHHDAVRCHGEYVGNKKL